MSDRPDDISKEAWEAAGVVGEAMYGRHERGWVSWPLMSRPDGRFAHEIIARAIDQARREGYAAGVRAAAEVAECDCCDVCGESPGYPKCANEIAAEIRALIKEGGE